MDEGIDGPRALRPTEFESLRALTDVVFRPGMPEQYPQLYNADNIERLRVCIADGKCVSHVGMTERHALLFGCPIQVCCIGSVCTYPEYRGLGLASACFEDAVSVARKDGVDLMIVSGSRGLYRRQGCLHVGQDTRFVLNAADLPWPRGVSLPEVTLEEMTEEDLPLLQECYRNEPVRWVRPLDDYRYALQWSWVMDRRTEFLVVREASAFRGYLLVHPPREDRKSRIAEFAGDRRCLLASLPAVIRRYDLQELHWQVLRHDDLFRSLCESVALPGEPAATTATFKLINFPQLMARMGAYWEEKLGVREAANLRFWQQGDEYGFGFAGEEWVTDRDTATGIVFGDVEGLGAAAMAGDGTLPTALREILPLPCLWYGINYV